MTVLGNATFESFATGFHRFELFFWGMMAVDCCWIDGYWWSISLLTAGWLMVNGWYWLEMGWVLVGNVWLDMLLVDWTSLVHWWRLGWWIVSPDLGAQMTVPYLTSSTTGAVNETYLAVHTNTIQHQLGLHISASISFQPQYLLVLSCPTSYLCRVYMHT